MKRYVSQTTDGDTAEHDHPAEAAGRLLSHSPDSRRKAAMTLYDRWCGNSTLILATGPHALELYVQTHPEAIKTPDAYRRCNSAISDIGKFARTTLGDDVFRKWIDRGAKIDGPKTARIARRVRAHTESLRQAAEAFERRDRAAHTLIRRTAQRIRVRMPDIEATAEAEQLPDDLTDARVATDALISSKNDTEMCEWLRKILWAV